MAWRVVWDEKALDDLRALDVEIARKIVVRVRDHLAESPLRLGKPLVGIFKGLHRYRYGDYRILYAVSRQQILITVVRVALRRDAYR